MARKLTSLKKPDPKVYKGWTFVLILAAILTVLALFHRGGVDALRVTEPEPSATSTPCQFVVTIDNLNVRSTPSLDGNAPVQTVSRGQQVTGTATVRDGYRALDGGMWALDQHLAPAPGSTCG